MVSLTATLLWIAACYQVFDGLQLGSGFCLRGAGDTRFPAVMLLLLSWTVFLPLTHVLLRERGGPCALRASAWEPSADVGAVVYIVMLGMAWGRWHSALESAAMQLVAEVMEGGTDQKAAARSRLDDAARSGSTP